MRRVVYVAHPFQGKPENVQKARGKFYPCKHDIFEKTYELAEE